MHFIFLAFVIASRYCYSPEARSRHVRIRDIFDYFHSRLKTLYDVNICTMNMHLLLHLADQCEKFGALPFGSMFSFEHQFWNFKLFIHGNTAILKQICEKVMLIKRGSTFLRRDNYDKKHDLLRITSLQDNIRNETVFVDRGHVIYRNKPFYSEAYRRKSKGLSTVYEIQSAEGHKFAKVLKFERRSDGEITADVEYLTRRYVPMFSFNNLELPFVSEHVVEMINQQTLYFLAFYSNMCDSISFACILDPCVVVKDFDSSIDSSILLIMPCSSVFEYN